MDRKQATVPDHTAVRVALWRAMHVEVDASPHVLIDKIGLQLAAPDESWRQQPDMHPQGTRGYRAAIVGRARYVEDLVEEQVRKGVGQYVILGAGLDTFVQRRPDLASMLRVFEIDKPETQEWKRQRLMELGLGIPNNLQLVPVDFEAGDSWREKLAMNDFNASKPAVVASTGVSLYLTREANMATMRQIAALAPGSTLAMAFMLPADLVDPAERSQYEMVQERAAAAGTPFVSLFRPPEILALAHEAGFRDIQHISRNDVIQRYFADRTDGLQPASGEEFLVATT
jgi:methyltransferase (TIGR00027 family)